MFHLLFVILPLLLLFNCTLVMSHGPVIAILAQEYWGDFGNFTPRSHAYIAASYVKYIEGAGGRVLPVLLDKDVSYYQKVISLANGLLLPGGGQYLDGTSAYEREGRLLSSLVDSLHENGVHFPVWGTCLGFELVALHAAQENVLSPCESQDQALPLEFCGDESNIKTSKLFKSIPSNLFNILSTENVTFNYHKKCITRESFEQSKLNNSFTILSVNKDEHGKEFISSFESKKYPIFGVQFHPEKNIYEFVNQKALHTNIPHDSNAIQVSQYFANFFVDQCRLNNHTWSEESAGEHALIYSFKPEHTIDTESFEQMYFFKRHST